MAEEKINVLYKGKIIEVVKDEQGSYCVDLPAPEHLTRTLRSFEGGWQFDEYETSNPSSYCWLKLTDDGMLEFANDMSSKKSVLAQNYNPELSCLDIHTDLRDQAKEMYSVIKQVEGYEKLGVAPVDVITLRKNTLDLALKMLGYRDKNDVLFSEPNLDESIMDLSHAVDYLENFPVLGPYVERKKSGIDIYEVKTPADFSKEKFKKDFKSAQEDYEKEVVYVAERKGDIDRRRDDFLLPDFCKGLKQFIQKKGTKTTWGNYFEAVKSLSKILLESNSDLLDFNLRSRIVQSVSSSRLEVMDRITRITLDRFGMNPILDAETEFFEHETIRLSVRVGEQISTDRTKDTTTAKIMKEVLEETYGEVERRREAIKNRDYHENIRPFDRSRKKVANKKDLKEHSDDYGYEL